MTQTSHPRTALPAADRLDDLRERQWCAGTPGGLLVLRHAEAWDILRDRRFGPAGRPALPPLPAARLEWLLRHRLPALLAALPPAADLAAEVVGAGPVDVAARFAEPYGARLVAVAPVDQDRVAAAGTAWAEEGDCGADLAEDAAPAVFLGYAVPRLLARAVAAFAEHPGQWNLLAERPELAASAVDELLRRWPPVPRTTRAPRYAVDYRGVCIPGGTPVTVVAAVAGRDPRAYADPDGFDIARPRHRPEVALGGPPYSRLALPILRAAAGAALVALATRAHPPRPAGDGDHDLPAR